MERTEELGLAARLPIAVGGQPVELRTLNLDESEEWQKKFNEFDLTSGSAMTGTTDAMLELVLAYDVDGVLGSDVRRRFTRRELYSALLQMAKAEIPFLEDAPSMEKAFGEALAAALMGVQYQQVSSTNGHSPTGGSTRKRSARASHKNGS